MKFIFNRSLLYSALAVLISAATSSPDVAAGGSAGSPEPGAGCEAANKGQICSAVLGSPYVGSAEIFFDADSNFAVFESQFGARQLGNSGCTMGDPQITGAQSLGDADFQLLNRRDIQGFCVRDVEYLPGLPQGCAVSNFAEVLAVQRFVGPIEDPNPNVGPFYQIEVLLLPVDCM